MWQTVVNSRISVVPCSDCDRFVCHIAGGSWGWLYRGTYQLAVLADFYEIQAEEAEKVELVR